MFVILSALSDMSLHEVKIKDLIPRSFITKCPSHFLTIQCSLLGNSKCISLKKKINCNLNFYQKYLKNFFKIFSPASTQVILLYVSNENDGKSILRLETSATQLVFNAYFFMIMVSQIMPGSQSSLGNVVDTIRGVSGICLTSSLTINYCVVHTYDENDPAKNSWFQTVKWITTKMASSVLLAMINIS